MTFLVKVKAPAEYGELQAGESKPVYCWEKLADDEWVYGDATNENLTVFGGTGNDASWINLPRVSPMDG